MKRIDVSIVINLALNTVHKHGIKYQAGSDTFIVGLHKM